jgi:predicted membrane-bound spermidine synthase
MPRLHPSRAAFYLLFTLSGFAGLIYESIWTHYLKLFLGHAAYAQSLVLVVFMGGMAAGSAWCSRISARLKNPLAGYALVEAIVGLCAVALHEIFVAVTGWSYASLLPGLGSEWLVLGAKLAISCLLILPQSVLLGATFPLMSAGLVRAHPQASGESVSMLYFTNSLGAAVGVLVGGFLLIDWVGLPGTLRTAGSINLALAAVVWLLARPMAAPALAARAGGEPRVALALLAVALLTGMASFIYEIGWIRMLSLVLGSSTHSFELMLSTFILGLALGGYAVRRRVDAVASPERLIGWVQLAKGLLALLTLIVYDRSFELMEFLMKGLARNESGYLLFNLSGQAIAALVMLPATFCAGMTLPLLTGALLRRAAGERAIGQVYAANTLGAIAGVMLAVHIGLPGLGLKGTIVAGSLVDAGIGLALLYAFAAPRRVFAFAAAASLALFIPIAAAFKLDVNKMTAGVFRHGDLESSRDARILYAKDGKTATVHLAQYGSAYSIRTNGKSDGSINMTGDEERDRGSDEITMVLTAAVPLALKPEAKSAAVIGIGTGLTTHTLLQSLAIERVETVEIEAAMAEASRGFMPRNGATFLDPRSRILIDDAKTFFSSHNRRYDILISEPSNPWVSGVSSLFTREFYRRIRAHLNPGGMLVQWFQLYEIDASLLASVMRALGEEFPHYAIYAPSDHDVLIIAGDAPPGPPQARVFEQPGVAKELWTVHLLAIGDLDARYLGNRATLEPLFASYGMPANSDYYPVLDLNAARHRFTEKSATDVVALLNLGVPVLELLEPGFARRAANPLHKGAYSFERIENARQAAYARDFLLRRPPPPQDIPTQLQKDLEVVKLRLLECRDPRELDVWLHSLLRVAKLVNPALPPGEARALWARVAGAGCVAALHEFQRHWIRLFQAVGAREAQTMAALAAQLLETTPELSADGREYLLLAGMSGAIAAARHEQALALWDRHVDEIPGAAAQPGFRLLRCHAGFGADSDCADAFRAYGTD